MRLCHLPLVLALTLAPLYPAQATELVHRFESPSFGGNPANGTFLLNQAEDQNKFEDPSKTRNKPGSQKSDLERFKDRLQQSILNKISQDATSDLFDDNGNIKENSELSFDLDGDQNGDFFVSVGPKESNGTITIRISDGITDTILTVPYH
ncbi:curli assembly protein CsgF [Methylomicrobium lacus]|uniref:curli assembly protein CsgF n=1 Tax=Methylomicrobium lacus TaxID=136992 RepID=UPI0035A87640